jgi:hypothetical protein
VWAADAGADAGADAPEEEELDATDDASGELRVDADARGERGGTGREDGPASAVTVGVVVRGY